MPADIKHMFSIIQRVNIHISLFVLKHNWKNIQDQLFDHWIKNHLILVQSSVTWTSINIV